MEIIYWFSPILNVLSILSIITGMYIAGNLLPFLVTWVQGKYPSNVHSSPFSRIILWLAIGTIFSSPLLDFVSLLGNLLNITLAKQGGSKFTTLLGSVSYQIYFSFPFLVMILVYAIVISYGFGFISSSKQFHRAERIFIVLAVASLVFGVINSVYIQVLSFQAPFIRVQQDYGLPGYLFEVLVGTVILIVILIGLNRLLSTHPASRDP